MSDHTTFEDQTTQLQRSGQHPVSIGYLVMGVAFSGLFGMWAVIANGALQGEDLRFIAPIPWLLAGIAGLAAIVASNRR